MPPHTLFYIRMIKISTDINKHEITHVHIVRRDV